MTLEISEIVGVLNCIVHLLHIAYYIRKLLHFLQ